MGTTRLVIDNECSIEQVTAFAQRYGLAFVASREETAEYDAEAVWATPDNEDRLRRLVNSFLGVTHLQFEGDLADGLVLGAHVILGGTRPDEIVHLFETDFDNMMNTWAIGTLGILTLPTFDARVATQFDRLFAHEHPGVRKAAIHASGEPQQFPAWDDHFVRAWTRLAAEDPDETVRTLAQVAVAGARPTTPQASGVPTVTRPKSVKAKSAAKKRATASKPPAKKRAKPAARKRGKAVVKKRGKAAVKKRTKQAPTRRR